MPYGLPCSKSTPTSWETCAVFRNSDYISLWQHNSQVVRSANWELQLRRQGGENIGDCGDGDLVTVLQASRFVDHSPASKYSLQWKMYDKRVLAQCVYHLPSIEKHCFLLS